jgi:hypothetical protein
MKRLLSIFLVIVVVFAVAPVLAASVPVDLFTHHLSVASIGVATPAALSYTLNEWLRLRRYSRAHWYRMRPEDRPDVIGEGRTQRITAEADARWEKQQELKAKTESRAA